MMIATGCSSSSTNKILDEASEPVDVVAVYLVGEGSQISANDLEKHPEVIVVDNFADFQTAASSGRIQLWVDKTAVDLVDAGWLRSKPQVYYSLVLVGYNDHLYSFRENLHRFVMGGGIVFWDTMTLEPGFSVQVPLQDDYEPSPFAPPCFGAGYDQVPTVKGILDIVRTVEGTKNAVLRMR